MKWSILLCFLFSGISSLIFQVVWIRLLGLVFGTSHFAIATVLTAFMSGLALGAWFTGRLSDKHQANFLRGYGLLEILVGIYGLFTPIFISYLMQQYAYFYQNFSPNFYLFSLLRFAVLFVFLLPPTVMMGATLPLLCKFLTQKNNQNIGQKIGVLYGINTFGAVLGTAFAGFFLIPHFGIQHTIYTAVFLSILAGSIALVISFQKETEMPTIVSLEKSQEILLPPLQIHKNEFRFMLFAFFCSGAISLSYEIGWSRILILILGGSVYSFTTMLATFLFGLALGSVFMARYLERVLVYAKEIFCLLQLLIGLTSFFTMHLFQKLPDYYVKWVYQFHQQFTLFHFMQCLLAGLVMFLPTFFLGMLFPLMARVHSLNTDIGKSVGDVYSINTLGCIVGSFGMGFILVPSFGVFSSLVFCVLGNFCIALFAWIILCRAYIRAASTFLLMSILLAFPPPWDPEHMTSGVFRYAPRIFATQKKEKEQSHFLRRKFTSTIISEKTEELLFYKDGLTATVSVHQQKHQLLYKTNGKPDASSGVDMVTQLLLGHLPHLLYPGEPENTLVIGLASGITAGSVACYPQKKITCLELEEASISAAKFFAPYNRGIIRGDLENGRFTDVPNFEVKIIDARNYLLGTETQYSIIISEPSNPWMSGPSNLFTQEFFQLCQKRLKPNGVLCQWIQLYEISWENFQVLIRTLHQSFPHIRLQIYQNDVLLLASQQPIVFDWNLISKRMENAEVKEDLARIHITHPAHLMAYLWSYSEDIASLFQDSFYNTDNNAYIEFTAPKQLFSSKNEDLVIKEKIGEYTPLPLKKELERLPENERLAPFIAYLQHIIRQDHRSLFTPLLQQEKEVFKLFSAQDHGELLGWFGLLAFLTQQNPEPFFQKMQQHSHPSRQGFIWFQEWNCLTKKNTEKVLSALSQENLLEASRVRTFAYFQQEDYESAIKEAENAYPDWKNWSFLQQIHFLNHYGRALIQQKNPDYEKGITLLKESEAHFWNVEKDNDFLEFEDIYQDIGKAYLALKQFQNATSYFIHSINLHQKRSIHYYRKAQKTEAFTEKEQFLQKSVAEDPSFYQASLEYWKVLRQNQSEDYNTFTQEMKKNFSWFEADVLTGE